MLLARGQMLNRRTHVRAFGVCPPAASYSSWPVVSSGCKKSRGLHSSIVYPIAREAVQRLGALFDIERGTNGKRPAERLSVRQELRAPLMAQLRTRLTAQVTKLSRGQDLTTAYFDMLKRRDAFTRFPDDGRICLSPTTPPSALFAASRAAATHGCSVARIAAATAPPPSKR